MTEKNIKIQEIKTELKEMLEDGIITIEKEEYPCLITVHSLRTVSFIAKSEYDAFENIVKELSEMFIAR